jgi:SAM-dependent methyltransferase
MIHTSKKPRQELGDLFRHIPCDLCGEHDFEPLGRPKITKKMEEIAPISILEDIFIVRCNRCGFYYTVPMPFWTEEALQTIYDSEYFPRMTAWWGKVKMRANPKRRLDTIEQHVPFKISRFLEVGCGLGYSLEEARRRSWAAYGQEVSRFFAQQVENRLGLEIFVGLLEEASYADSYFDAVYVDSVLEHLPQPMKMLKEIHRILKPQGVAYITVTNEDALINKFWGWVFRILQIKRSPILSPLAYPVHLVGFTPDTLRRACETMDFEVRSLVVCAGGNEWRKYRIHEIGRLLLNIACYPIYLLGELMEKGIAIEAVISPRK